MKKAYISPATRTIALNLESMVAMSVVVNPDSQLGAGDSYTNKRNGGWSCEDWSNDTDEIAE